MQQQAETAVHAPAQFAGRADDLSAERRAGDLEASSPTVSPTAESLRGQNPQLALHSYTSANTPHGSSSMGSLPAVGSNLSLQGLDPVHDQTLDPPARNSELTGLEPTGRTPGGATAASRHMGADDLMTAAMSGLDINPGKEHNLGGSGLRRPGSYSSLSHGTGLHADDCLEASFQPRALVIHNLMENVSDEDLQKDLESYGDVSTLYTATKSQGQVMVTFYSSLAAGRAFAALQGRNIHGRELQVDFHFSQKDAQAGRVFLFDVKEGVSDQQVSEQMEAYGSIMSVRPHPTVPHCREVLYHDTRAAQQAFNAIYHQAGGVPTINEDDNDPQPPIHVGLRNQSYPSFGSLGGGPMQDANYDWSRSQQWDSNSQGPHLSHMLGQGQNTGSNDMLAFLNQSSPNTLDHLMRQGYLPNHGSSSSLGQGLGSSSALRGLDSQAGSSANLGGLTSSASHPDLAASFLQNESPERSDSLPHPNQQSFNQLAGGGNLTAGQMAALQSSGLLGGMGSAGIARGRRGMSTPDLTALPHNLPNLGKQGWNGGGQYNPSELSGWGSNLGNAYPGSNMDTSALLAAQGNLNLGGLGAMQRSMSALQLQHQNQQQQQLLMQLAMNPQALAQLSNMRMGPMPPHSHSNPNLSRSKSHRSDDNLAGGRLSRRAADPTVEAERRAQQDRQFALDEAKVLSGEDTRTTLMIKNIPNKYTQKMLLQTIDEQFSRLYDFFYLPIDFKNKCNVGYAFINMVQPKYIVPLTKRFNQRKWERFNSEKVCHISYARIQGKNQLITHFQNSSLLHEDKRCRPILFKSEGDLAGEQEPFPTSTGVRSHRARPFSAGNDAPQ